MATSKKSKAAPKIEWQGYLNVNLDTDDEVAFDAWEVDRVFTLADVAVLVDNGYKFALNWDNFHSGFVASLYSGSTKLAWTGWTLTAWSDSADEAIRLLFFKHYYMCEEDWEKFTYKPEKSQRRRG
jgi:hypothetical protein